MSRRQRRKFSPDDKAAIWRRHLSDKVPVSDLCEEYKQQPRVFYQWQRQLLDLAAKALEPQRGLGRREKKMESKIEALKSRPSAEPVQVRSSTGTTLLKLILTVLDEIEPKIGTVGQTQPALYAL